MRIFFKKGFNQVILKKEFNPLGITNFGPAMSEFPRGDNSLNFLVIALAYIIYVIML